MKCSRAQKLINDQIDNILDPGRVRRLESHLERCADCRELFADLRSIVHRAGELETPVPSEASWPVIKREVLKRNREVRIRGNGRFGDFFVFFRGPVFAFSTLLAVILLVPLLYFGRPGVRNTENNPGENVLSNYKMAEQQYQSAIEALDRTIEARGVKLSPELMGVFKKNLAIIDESIRVCIKSIDENPKIRETNKLLLICYRKKVELLNELKEITLQSGGNT